MVASRKFKKGGQKKIPVVEARPVMGSEGNNLPIAKAILSLVPSEPA